MRRIYRPGISPACSGNRSECRRASSSNAPRLSESLARLTATEVPIDRLAASVGYRSADAFSRAFRRQFGIAPSDYRERFSSVGG